MNVRAAAAKPYDWKVRNGEMKMLSGRKFPRGLDYDIAGVVEAIGPGVTGFEWRAVAVWRSRDKFLILSRGSATPHRRCLRGRRLAGSPLADTALTVAALSRRTKMG